MSDKKQRIDEDVIETIKFIKKWLWLSKKIRLNFSETVNYISQDFVKINDIIKKTDITEKEIKINDNILTKYRVDTNIPSDLRDDIKIIQYVLNKDRKEEEKKLTIDDIIKMMVDKTFELYPDIKKAKLEDKYLIQRIQLEEIRRKRLGGG